jgi:hypothetical protein
MLNNFPQVEYMLFKESTCLPNNIVVLDKVESVDEIYTLPKLHKLVSLNCVLHNMYQYNS